MCVTRVRLTSGSGNRATGRRGPFSGNTFGSPYRVLRGSPRGALRTIDRECAGRNGPSVKGSPVSPVLAANIDLHFPLDQRFDENHRTNGRAIRYANAEVFVFENLASAEKFQPPLEQHLRDVSSERSSMKHTPRSRMREIRTSGSVRSAGRQRRASI